jgi:hypothetical protein
MINLFPDFEETEVDEAIKQSSEKSSAEETTVVNKDIERV